MAYYRRTDLAERTCECGCKETYKPGRDNQKYVNDEHRMRAFYRKHPDKRKPSKKGELLDCIRMFYEFHRSRSDIPSPRDAVLLAKKLLSVD